MINNKMSKTSRRTAMAIILGGAGYIVCPSVTFAGIDQVSKRIDAITKKKGAKERKPCRSRKNGKINAEVRI